MENVYVLVRMSTHSEAIPRESGSMQLPTAVAGTWVRDCLHRHELKQTWSTDLRSACRRIRRLVACFRWCPQYLALRFHFRTLLQQLLSEPLRDGTVILVTGGRMGSGSTVGQQPRQHGNPTNYTSTGGPRPFRLCQSDSASCAGRRTTNLHRIARLAAQAAQRTDYLGH